MYGEKLPVLTLSSPKKKKSFERRVGRADKGFVRNPDRCRVYPHVSIRAVFPNSRVTLQDLVRDWKVTLLEGDNYSCPYSKVTAILIKVSTLRGWNGEPIGSHFLRHIEDGNIDSERRGTSQKSRRDWLPDASFRPTKIER